MFRNNNFYSKTYGILILSLYAAGTLAACTPKQEQPEETQTKETEIIINISESDHDQNNPVPDEEKSSDGTAAAQTPQPSQADEVSASKAADITARFGEHCIAEQTFEVELSEYTGNVSFVPFAPSDNQDFHMQIIQNDTILADIPGYVPADLLGQSFSSLDAVSFYDINFDGNTDILLIETYGNTSFAAVYYGFDADADDYRKYFIAQERLSNNITLQVSPLSISQIRILLSGGKRNGEFSNYQEAYQAVARLWSLAESTECQYGLIYVDDDDIPELTAGLNGYYISLYTYVNGKVSMLMDQWAYGAMGNAGYEYSPRKNSIRNDNADYAGAILHTTYMSITNHQSLDTIASIKFYNFDDANENGIPDEEELDSMGMYGVSYLNGVEASAEECSAYDAGGYEYINGDMTLEALLTALNQ